MGAQKHEEHTHVAETDAYPQSVPRVSAFRFEIDADLQQAPDPLPCSAPRVAVLAEEAVLDLRINFVKPLLCAIGPLLIHADLSL